MSNLLHEYRPLCNWIKSPNEHMCKGVTLFPILADYIIEIFLQYEYCRRNWKKIAVFVLYLHADTRMISVPLLCGWKYLFSMEFVLVSSLTLNLPFLSSWLYPGWDKNQSFILTWTWGQEDFVGGRILDFVNIYVGREIFQMLWTWACNNNKILIYCHSIWQKGLNNIVYRFVLLVNIVEE